MQNILGLSEASSATQGRHFPGFFEVKLIEKTKKYKDYSYVNQHKGRTMDMRHEGWLLTEEKGHLTHSGGKTFVRDKLKK